MTPRFSVCLTDWRRPVDIDFQMSSTDLAASITKFSHSKAWYLGMAKFSGLTYSPGANAQRAATTRCLRSTGSAPAQQLADAPGAQRLPADHRPDAANREKVHRRHRSAAPEEQRHHPEALAAGIHRVRPELKPERVGQRTRGKNQ